MPETLPAKSELSKLYSRRFDRDLDYRNSVWKILTGHFFKTYVGPEDTLLDLGAGYGQFVNNIGCKKKLAMDLNLDSKSYLNEDVTLLTQSCSDRWQIESQSLNVIFTSNFFEHLPSKDSLTATLEEAFRCLQPGGRIIAMGPNIKYAGGAYWDFWDHYLPLTELSLKERLETLGFSCVRVEPRFLPYTMVGGPHYPAGLIRVYLQAPFLWKLLGKQFLIVAEKP